MKRLPLLPITALLVSTFFVMAGGGLMGILVPVRASIEGWSSYEIGLLGTAYAFAFTVGCLIAPRIVRQSGHVRTFASLSAALAIGMLLSGLLVDPIAWIVFRMLAGLGLAGSYMVVESWLNERVTNETRGSIYSIYMVVTMAAMMGGQYIMPLSDPGGQAAFMVCAILFIAAVIPTALSRAQSPKPLTTVRLDVRGLFRNSPVAAVGVLLAGILAAAWNNMSPVFGQRIGLSTTEIATLTVAAMAGGIAFQVPLGRISDRTDRRYVMVFVGFLGVVAAVAGLYLAQASAFGLFAVAFAVGGVVYPSYSIAVAHANDYADDSDFVKVSGGLLMLYGVGTMIGPLYAAGLMDSFGPEGIFQSLGTAAAVYGAYAYYRTYRREAPSDQTRSGFKSTPFARVQTPNTYALDPRADAAEDEEPDTTGETDYDLSEHLLDDDGELRHDRIQRAPERLPNHAEEHEGEPDRDEPEDLEAIEKDEELLAARDVRRRRAQAAADDE